MEIFRHIINKTQYQSTVVLHVLVVLLNKIQFVRKLENKALTFLQDRKYKSKLFGLSSDGKNSFPTSHVTVRLNNDKHCR